MDNRLRYILFAVSGALLIYMLYPRLRHHEPAPATVESGGTVVQGPASPRAEQQYLHVVTPSASGGRGGLDAQVTTRSAGMRALWLTGAQFAESQEHPNLLTTVLRALHLASAPPGENQRVDPLTGQPTAERRMNLRTTYADEFLPLQMELAVQRNGAPVELPPLDFQGRQVSPAEVQLEWHGGGLDVVRTITSDRPFVLQVTTRVTNHGDAAAVDYQLPLYHWVRRADESGGFFRQSWKVAEGICDHHNDLFRENRDKLAERDPAATLPGTARFAGLGNLYFISAVVPRDDRTSCRLWGEERGTGTDEEGTVLQGSLVWPRATLAPNQSREYVAQAYFGPKEAGLLRALDPSLTQAINLGFFALIARVLVQFLGFLYSLVHNWGVAIILLTVCVRIALYPLLARSTRSLAMMQRLKPQLDEINEKFKDNQEAKGLATMELYRRNGINPLSGCLPQVAQLPVWWALYTTLQTSVELFHAPFFGPWQDLSAPDHTFVLPLVLGAIMFIQQKIMPPQAMDPVQAKIMMYFMPIFLTAISLYLPAGLALYMLVNSILTILQQKVTKAQLARLNVEMAGAGTGGGQAIVVKPVEPAGLKGGRSGRA